MPYHNMPYHAIPYHAMQYHTLVKTRSSYMLVFPRSTPFTDVVTVGVFDLNGQAQEKARDFRIRRIIQADNFLHIESPFR